MFGDPVFAGWYSLNGNGEMTGTTWVEESGFLEGPVMITNTHSVGVVRDAVIQWRVQHSGEPSDKVWWGLPVVAETYDGYLNDINGFHVKPEHVFHALDMASGGAVQEGNVGGGTGMICNGFKGGTGTASRRLDEKHGGYTVGVLAQCNYGKQEQLRIAGIPVGRELPPGIVREKDQGSIIVVVATDAPLLPNQLKRLARRVPLGLGRDGSYSGNGSGDIFIAFSTANSGAWDPKGVKQVAMLPNDEMEPHFPRHCAVRRRSRDQRDGRGSDHDRHQRPHSERHTAQGTSGSAEEVQPAGAEVKTAMGSEHLAGPWPGPRL